MKLKLLTTITLCGIGITLLQAQTMNLKDSNTQTSYALSNILKLSFSNSNLIITQTNSDTKTYVLNELQYLKFDNSSTNTQTPEIAENNLNIYPNPANQFLNIDLSGQKDKQGVIQILNINGNILLTQTVGGLDTISLNISQLPKGTYLCRYVTNTEIKSIKIIKQ